MAKAKVAPVEASPNGTTPMDLAAWRAARAPEEVTLPSGLRALVCKPSIMDLAISGHIPMSLLSALAEDGEAAIDLAEVFENLPEYAGMINAIFKAAMVSPPVADEPSDTHLGIGESDMEDRMWVFGWAMGDTDALRPFRGE